MTVCRCGHPEERHVQAGLPTMLREHGREHGREPIEQAQDGMIECRSGITELTDGSFYWQCSCHQFEPQETIRESRESM